MGLAELALVVSIANGSAALILGLCQLADRWRRRR
jgi:hypothetical protein